VINSTVQTLLFGSQWLIGCSPSLSPVNRLGLTKKKLERKKVRPLESRCVLLVLPSTIPLLTTMWYRMVLDSKHHRIYDTIEFMVPAQP